MKELIYKISKYIITATIIFLLLKYAPNTKINNSDICTIISIVLIIQMLYDLMHSDKQCSVCVKEKCECEDFENTSNKTKESSDNKQTMNHDDEEDDAEGDNEKQNDNDVDEEETDVLYSDLSNAQYVKLGDFGNSCRKSYRDPKYKGEYGDWFIPPEEWYPPCSKTPRCVTNNGCPVQPVYTDGTNIDLREFDNSRKIAPPSDINVNYINKLNGCGKSQKIKGKRNVPNNPKTQKSMNE